MTRAAFLLPLLLLGGVSGAVAPQSQPELDQPQIPAILQKAIARSGNLRYIGRRTVEFLRGPRNLRHDEIVIRDGARSRVEFPTGSPYAGQVIVEDGRERKHYLPDRNEIRVSPARREEAFRRLRRVLSRDGQNRLTASTQPGETVAGLHTDQVVLTDGANNVIERLYIDPKSGMVLKRRLYDGAGAQIGFYEFSQIDLSPRKLEPSLFRIDRKGATVITPYDTARYLAGRQGFLPVVLPRSTGYRLETVRVVPLGEKKVFMQIYTGPRGKLSFYQLDGAIDADRLRAFARGDYRTRSWRRGGKTFVILASLEEGALARIAQTAGEGTP